MTPMPSSATPAVDGAPPSTRERILDVAQHLFAEQGYDATSLREIADAMGFTKAALYYHFASKDELLLALHIRFHDLFGHVLDRLASAGANPEAWRNALGELVDAIVDQRELVVFQQRNHSAIARDLHGKAESHAANEDLEAAVQRVLGDTSLPARQRIRLAAAMGAVIITMTEASEFIAGVTEEQLATEMRAVVGDLLVGG